MNDPYNYSSVTGILDQVAADLSADNRAIRAKVIIYPIVLPNNVQQAAPSAPVAAPVPPFDNGVVYVRLVQDNQQTTSQTQPTNSTTTTKDITAYFYSDQQGTVPKSVTRLKVGLVQQETESNNNGNTYSNGSFNYTCNGTSQMLQPGAPVSESVANNGGDSLSWYYYLNQSAYYTIIS